MSVEILKLRLDRLDDDSARRSLVQSRAQGFELSSNDYLGFGDDETLKRKIIERLSELPNGAAGSRLLRGNLPIFEEVEQTLAKFSGRETALLFSSGYQANLGLLSSLLRPGDTVFSDENNHASLIDGARLSGAEKKIYSHCDPRSLRVALQACQDQSGVRVIVTESLFSMDGSFAPLRELAELAEEFSALLIVDEAHATGLWGDFTRNQGAGLVQAQGLSDRVFATVHTGGKALGCGGAWVAGEKPVRDSVVNFARPFIFSTAPIPAAAVSLMEATEHWKNVGAERARETLLCAKLMRESIGMQPNRQGCDPCGPILPIIVGSNERALNIAEDLKKEGFDIRAIRPPTVPHGTARFRITSTWRMRRERQVGSPEWIRFKGALQAAMERTVWQ